MPARFFNPNGFLFFRIPRKVAFDSRPKNADRVVPVFNLVSGYKMTNVFATIRT